MKKLILLSILLIVGCEKDSTSSESSDDSSGNGGDASDTGRCEWHGNCSSTAPNGAYDSGSGSDERIYKCIDGEWVSVINCRTVWNSDGYTCTAKGGCGTLEVVCSYAGKSCGIDDFETCGENAHAGFVDGKRVCIDD